MKSKRKALNTHGVWWVLLLTYSHAVYASLTVLNCPFITDSNGATSPVKMGKGQSREGKHNSSVIFTITLKSPGVYTT